MRRLTANFAAFSLVEVALAVGIAGFGLTAIFGLLPIGLECTRTAIEQTKAMDIATSVAADLRSTPSTANVSPRLGIQIPPPGSPETSVTVYLDEFGGPSPAPATPASTSRFRAVITLAPPAASGRSATYGTISLGWPAQAPPANAAASVSCFLALDRN
jgi:uncharacterized protein (TIGR02598 family)